MDDHDSCVHDLHRRSFIRSGALFLLGTGVGASQISSLLANESRPKIRLGLVTDLHYADKAPAGSRHYRETLDKLNEAAEQFQQDQPGFVVELGDFIDVADSVAVEKAYLQRINREFTALPGKKHYVLGNHCVDMLTKEEFLDAVEQSKSYHSFDSSGFHFVVLDACFRHDGQPYGRKNFTWTDANIPSEQVEWLQGDLQSTTGKTVVFVHQRLDVRNHYGVKNADQVRKVLEDSGKVLAVFQGHSHRNDVNNINGIHYCVLRAMVEGSGETSNGYSTMDLFADGTICLSGFRKQESYAWRRSGKLSS